MTYTSNRVKQKGYRIQTSSITQPNFFGKILAIDKYYVLSSDPSTISPSFLNPAIPFNMIFVLDLTWDLISIDYSMFTSFNSLQSTMPNFFLDFLDSLSPGLVTVENSLAVSEADFKFGPVNLALI